MMEIKCSNPGCLKNQGLVDYYGTIFCINHLPFLAKVFINKIDLAFLLNYYQRIPSIAEVLNYAYAFKGNNNKNRNQILEIAKNEIATIDIDKCQQWRKSMYGEIFLFNNTEGTSIN